MELEEIIEEMKLGGVIEKMKLGNIIKKMISNLFPSNNDSDSDDGGVYQHLLRMLVKQFNTNEIYKELLTGQSKLEGETIISNLLNIQIFKDLDDTPKLKGYDIIIKLLNIDEKMGEMKPTQFELWNDTKKALLFLQINKIIEAHVSLSPAVIIKLIERLNKSLSGKKSLIASKSEDDIHRNFKPPSRGIPPNVDEITIKCRGKSTQNIYDEWNRIRLFFNLAYLLILLGKPEYIGAAQALLGDDFNEKLKNLSEIYLQITKNFKNFKENSDKHMEICRYYYDNIEKFNIFKQDIENTYISYSKEYSKIFPNSKNNGKIINILVDRFELNDETIELLKNNLSP